MDEKKGPYIYGETRRMPSRAGDPRCDVIESGSMRGRRAVTLGIVRATRAEVAKLAGDLVRFGGIEGKFARDRARSIEAALGALERVARLPADPATDYAGPAPGGGGDLAGDV
jgi:hypothetical protein